MNARGDRMGGGRIFLVLRQHQQVVVNRALVLVQKDVVGADDLPESDRGVGIVGPQIRMRAFDRLAKGSPQTFGIVLREGPKQIVKRIHCALAAGFTRAPSNCRKFAAEYASTKFTATKMMLM